MRKFFTFCLCSLLISCLSESGVTPGSSETFIRYFNGGNNDEAQDLAVADDGGFVILATTKIQKAESDTLRTKIKLIKTDKTGNPLWQMLYPGFSVTDRNYSASAIQVVPNGGGYIIAGGVIDDNGISKTLVMLVDENGVTQNSLDLDLDPGINEKGKGIAINSTGNYLALSSQGTSKMIITEIDKTTFTTISSIGHSQGDTELDTRLVVDETDKAVWSGVVTSNGLKGVRLTKTIPANINVEFDQLLGNPGFNEVGNDFCKYGLIYVITGSTNQKPGGTTAGADTDILFKRVDANGEILSTASFPIEGQNDIGNSINTTLDGGLILLASANSAGIGGRGDSDFYLIKINGFGEQEWTSAFGSRFKDEGVIALQSADGGYVILGTTTQGSIKIITLAKTDNKGKIE
jgi:hypothetical protein